MEGRVLVVEDDASIREVTALGLRRAGFRVDTAVDGRAALATWRARPVDLIVLDVMLPGLDGCAGPPPRPPAPRLIAPTVVSSPLAPAKRNHTWGRGWTPSSHLVSFVVGPARNTSGQVWR